MLMKPSKAKGRGKELVKDSMHLEADLLLSDTDSEAEDIDTGGKDADGFEEKEQDLHCQLSILLEDFVKIQGTGFLWDLKYKGKVYQDVEFVVFVPFIKCDTVEADKLCAKYQSRHQHVKHLC